MNLNTLPMDIDNRKTRRHLRNLRVICKEPETLTTINSTNTVDICYSGACINYHKPINVGKKMILKIAEHNDVGLPVEQNSEVVWANNNRIGVKFSEPFTAAAFSKI